MQYAARILCLALTVLSVFAGTPQAGPAPCATAVDPLAKAAVTAAEARWAAHWRKGPNGWATDYTSKPAPKNPLGLNRLPNASDGPVAIPPPDGPIAGSALVETLACSYYEIDPETGFIVRFVGHRLSFSENGGKFSRPIERALIEALVIRQRAKQATTLEITPLPNAETAIAPDMILTLPLALSPAAPAPSVAKRH